MQFQLRVPEGFRGRIYTHKVTNGNSSVKGPKLTFPIGHSITGGHSALFAGTEATPTHFAYQESVGSQIAAPRR